MLVARLAWKGRDVRNDETVLVSLQKPQLEGMPDAACPVDGHDVGHLVFLSCPLLCADRRQFLSGLPVLDRASRFGHESVNWQGIVYS